MGNNSKGKNNWSYGKTGKDSPNYGKKNENQSKRMMRENNPCYGRTGKAHPNYGQKSPEHSIMMMGENNSNWKGGKSHEPYCKEWNFDEFKEIIRSRDDYVCQNPDCHKNCNPNHKLCVHHIDGNKKNCEPWNLISLCKSCNIRAEGNKDFLRIWWQKLYQNIMTKKYRYRIIN